MDNLTGGAEGEADPATTPVEFPAGPLSWGVRPAITLFCLAATLGAVAWLLLAAGNEDRVVAGIAALMLATASFCAFRMRRRLVADHAGLLVTAPLGSRRIGWEQVAGIDVPVRRRRGLTSVTVEIDLDDDTLIVLGRLDLGTDPAEVGRTLRALAAQTGQ